MFHILILQDPVEGAVRSTKKYCICMCDFEASARPINIVLQKGHAPCYLLEVDISRNLKGWVPVENTLSQRETQRSVPHALARVKREKFEQIFITNQSILRHLRLDHATEPDHERLYLG